MDQYGRGELNFEMWVIGYGILSGNIELYEEDNFGQMDFFISCRVIVLIESGLD